MGTYVNRLQKTFGKTPIVFSTQAQALADKKANQLFIGVCITLTLAIGIYVGYQVRKKWWSNSETKDQPGSQGLSKTIIRPFSKSKSDSETYSNFLGIDKLSSKSKRQRNKILYFENRKNI